MDDVRFFDRAGPYSVSVIAGWLGAQSPAGAAERSIRDVAPLDVAAEDQISYFEGRRYAGQLAASTAGACIVGPGAASQVPAGVMAIEVGEPARAFAEIVNRFYPEAHRPLPLWGDVPFPAGAAIHPTARIEDDVVVEPGAVIGAEASIGRGTQILAGSMIGRRVHIGRNCSIGSAATIIHTLIGDRVVIHAGVRVGQDGFGYTFAGGRHVKVPQIGRVVIQDDVEIGANTTIDRGGLRDTVIGEGTKIDNLVQIGHNVLIGRHCAIAGQVGIAGSTRLGDYVVIGGQAGLADHVTIGDGVQLAAQSGVKDDLAAGGRYGGSPARTASVWAKEVAALRRLTQREIAKGRAGKGTDVSADDE